MENKENVIYDKDYFTGKGSFFWKLGYGKFARLYFNGLFLPIAKYIKGKKEGRVLDVGCAYGYLLERFPNSWQKFGIDISGYAIEKAKKKLPAANFFVKDAQENLPFEEGFFDVILLIDVLEHLQAPELALKNIYKVLKGGGILYIATPNLNRLRRILLSYGDRKEHHISMFSHLELNGLLISLGFQIEENYTSFYSLKFKSKLGTESVFICRK